MIVEVENRITDATEFVAVKATPAWTTKRAAYDYWVTCQVFVLTSSRTLAAASIRGRFLFTPTNHHLLVRGRSTCNPGVQVLCELTRFVLLAFTGWPNQFPLVCSLYPKYCSTKAGLDWPRERWTVASLLIVEVENGVTDATGFVTVEATPAGATQRAAYDYWVTRQVSASTSP